MDNADTNGQGQKTVEELKKGILIRDAQIHEIQEKFSKLMPDIITSIEERDLFRRPPHKIRETIETADPKMAGELYRIKKRKLRFFVVASLAVIAIFMMRVQNTVTSQGTIVPKLMVAIKSPSIGTIKRVYYSEGEFVRKGSLIAALSDQNYRSSLEEMSRRRGVAVAHLSGDLIQLEKLKVDLERVKHLVAEDALPRTARDEAQYRYELGAVTVQEQQKEIELLDAQKSSIIKNRNLTEIRSPIDGAMLTWAVNNAQGQFVQDGTALCEIGSLDTVMEALVEEKELKNVHLGDEVNMVFDIDPSKVYKGKVLKIAHSMGVIKKDIWTKAEVFAVQIDLLEKPSQTVIGMKANVEIVSGMKPMGKILFDPFINWAKRKLS